MTDWVRLRPVNIFLRIGIKTKGAAPQAQRLHDQLDQTGTGVTYAAYFQKKVRTILNEADAKIRGK
ncbi:hypothetical protein GWO25_00635 [Candidatus Saccharibacteria bacterium]|nr:hypothetical protein [Candidatus Saccharibacteria bacterium]